MFEFNNQDMFKKQLLAFVLEIKDLRDNLSLPLTQHELLKVINRSIKSLRETKVFIENNPELLKGILDNINNGYNDICNL